MARQAHDEDSLLSWLSDCLEYLIDHVKWAIPVCTFILITSGIAAAKLKLFEEVATTAAIIVTVVLFVLLIPCIPVFLWLWVRLSGAQKMGWLFDTKAGWRYSRGRGWYFMRRFILPSWRYTLYGPANPPLNWSRGQEPGWYYDGRGNWTYRSSVSSPSWRYELYDPQNPPIMPAQEGIPLPPLGFANDRKQAGQCRVAPVLGKDSR